MDSRSPESVTDLIGEEVAHGIRLLSFCLRCWVQTHLAPPRPIVLSIDPDGKRQETFWLVTDHSGCDDAPCRVVFDGDRFGLAVALPNGIECVVGRFGSFADAVQNM